MKEYMQTENTVLSYFAASRIFESKTPVPPLKHVNNLGKRTPGGSDGDDDLWGCHLETTDSAQEGAGGRRF